MCGNGVRCIAKYVYDHHLTDKTQISLETLGGIKYLDLNIKNGKVETVTVDMGAPILTSSEIPVNLPKNQVINEPVEIDGKVWHMTCVSMGNPHAVVFVDDTANLKLEHIGPLFEKHPLFPENLLHQSQETETVPSFAPFHKNLLYSQVSKKQLSFYSFPSIAFCTKNNFFLKRPRLFFILTYFSNHTNIIREERKIS